jgi:hypothetical protein
MTDDLSTLPQPAREAVEICDRDLPFYTERPSDHWSEPSAWYKVRAELLRLVAENEALRSKCNVLMSGSTRHLGRAERVEAELAALRARIAEAPVASVQRVSDYMGGIERQYVCYESDSIIDIPALHNKRVRLVVED